MEDDVKYAVVRVQGGQRMIDLFSLLVSHGYSEVSFVSSLANTILKTDNSASQDDASTSRVSSSSAAGGNGSAAIAAAAVSTTTSGQQQQPPTTSQQQQVQGGTSKVEDSSFSSPSKAANAADLLQSLFERNTEEDTHAQFAGHPQPWVLPTGEIPGPSTSLNGQPMMMPMGLMPASGFGGSEFGGPMQSVRSMNYTGVDGTGRKMPFTVRMKGWQRKMLNEAMAVGIPSGAELRDLCERCQAIRFFRKRTYGKAGEGNYQMEDEGDGMRTESPEEAPPQYQEPKMEDIN